MTAGDGKTAVLPGFDDLQGTTRGGVFDLTDELERLGKERARLDREHARKIRAIDKKIDKVWQRVRQAWNAP